MEPKREAPPFESNPQAVFSRGVTTRSTTKANKKKKLQIAVGSLKLTELPVDTQCCMLSFLTRNELARCAAINQACRSVATLDHMWEGFLADQFGAVKVTGNCRLVWGSTPARQFSNLAKAACTLLCARNPS